MSSIDWDDVAKFATEKAHISQKAIDLVKEVAGIVSTVTSIVGFVSSAIALYNKFFGDSEPDFVAQQLEALKKQIIAIYGEVVFQEVGRRIDAATLAMQSLKTTEATLSDFLPSRDPELRRQLISAIEDIASDLNYRAADGANQIPFATATYTSGPGGAPPNWMTGIWKAIYYKSPLFDLGLSGTGPFGHAPPTGAKLAVPVVFDPSEGYLECSAARGQGIALREQTLFFNDDGESVQVLRLVHTDPVDAKALPVPLVPDHLRWDGRYNLPILVFAVRRSPPGRRCTGPSCR
jgi:hypothetical protein